MAKRRKRYTRQQVKSIVRRCVAKARRESRGDMLQLARQMVRESQSRAIDIIAIALNETADQIPTDNEFMDGAATGYKLAAKRVYAISCRLARVRANSSE